MPLLRRQAGQADDVVAELGLHRPAQLALFGHGKNRLLKRRHHHAALNHAEVAAVLRGTRIGGMFHGQGGEVLAVTDAGEKIFGLFQRGGVGVVTFTVSFVTVTFSFSVIGDLN